MNKLMSCFASAAAAAMLAACGGGDDPAPAPPPADPTAEVPASASMTVQGLLDYLVALTNASADDKEPVSLDAFTPVVSDDTEPAAVE